MYQVLSPSRTSEEAVETKRWEVGGGEKRGVRFEDCTNSAGGMSTHVRVPQNSHQGTGRLVSCVGEVNGWTTLRSPGQLTVGVGGGGGGAERGGKAWDRESQAGVLSLGCFNNGRTRALCMGTAVVPPLCARKRVMRCRCSPGHLLFVAVLGTAALLTRFADGYAWCQEYWNWDGKVRRAKSSDLGSRTALPCTAVVTAVVPACSAPLRP